MDITRFGPDDVAALKEWVELANAVRLADSPWETEATLLRVEARFRVGWDGEPSTPYLATVDGTVVGGGAISISEYDNLHLAWLGVVVHPDHRRQGYGSAIVAFLEDEARRLGRTSVGMDGWESDATRGFAAKHGFDKKHQSINRRQHLADVDRAELDKRYDEALAAATDYVLERRRFPTPDAELAELAEMASAINDAPTDDLEIEDEVFNAERMKAYEDACAFRQERAYRVVARHVPSGQLAGQTVVVVDSEQPDSGRPARHLRRRCPPRPPARSAAQGRDGPLAGRGRAAARVHRHLERGVQRPHDRRQRDPRLPDHGPRARRTRSHCKSRPAAPAK